MIRILRRSLILFLLMSGLMAADWTVSGGQELTDALTSAASGDRILLAAGDYYGRFVIDTPLTLDGQNNATVHAGGTGDALVIKADRVHIKNLSVRDWGANLTDTNAAIKAVQVADILVSNTVLQGDGFGIYLENVNRALIQDNQVTGNDAMRSADRGNGIHLINSQQVTVQNNRVRDTRDGLYIISSQNNELRNNQMRNLRFGIHYMYSHSNVVSGNEAYDVDVGYALMSSQQLIIENNRAENCRDYGLLLNFINQSRFVGNHVESIHADTSRAISGDAGKAVFIYNSTGNVIERNSFIDSDLGIHLTAGSEGNQIFANNFINNRTQVKYVSSREQEWSHNGQGNYWSDYVGWDLDQDGTGDSVFEPNDGIDKLLWRYPEARVLMDSPAIRLLRWVQDSFPVLKASGVQDSYPSLNPIGDHS